MASASLSTVSWVEGAGLLLASGTGTFLVHLEAENARDELEFVAAPGLDGAGRKNYGYRGQRFHAEVIYVQANEGACLSAFQADCAAFRAALLGGTLGGLTVYAIHLESARAEQPTATGYDTVMMTARFVLDAKRNA